MADIFSSLSGGFGLPGGGDPEDIYGKKPKIPAAPDIFQSQDQALKANIKNFAEASKQASDINLFNQTELQKMIDRAVPGARPQMQENIMSRLKGQIPDSVLQALQRSVAEKGISSQGTVGSGFSLGTELSDQLGISLDLQNEGQDSLTRWLGATTTPLADATKMFLTPAQVYSSKGDTFQRDLLQNEVNAAPDPAARGVFDSTMALIGMVLSVYGGGAGYKGTYQPNYGGGGGGGSGGYGGVKNETGSDTWYIGNRESGWGLGTTKEGGKRKWFIGQHVGEG